MIYHVFNASISLIVINAGGVSYTYLGVNLIESHAWKTITDSKACNCKL